MPDQEKMSTTDIAQSSPNGAERNGAEQDVADQNGAVEENGERTVLFDERETEHLRRRWSDIQGGFVDRPKDSVSDADSLVAETMKRLAESFSQERTSLENVWSKGGDVSTEDLRVAMRRYRSFFERLLSA